MSLFDFLNKERSLSAGALEGEGVPVKGSNIEVVEKPTRSTYEKNLERYNKLLADRGDAKFRNICIPFQLVVETTSKDFEGGLQAGMQAASEKMTVAIQRFLAQQIKTRSFPIDSFAGEGGRMCFGMTVYMLTDEEMGQLEDALK